ncbi:hypothetical protein [Plantactinospora sp. WMMB782]|uniref:hypothetical protein n=1 Tax=Plantactinospora sp. WMMB782 TaxID=3404121 RepID=UPI003B9589F8
MPVHMLPDPEQTEYFMKQVTNLHGRGWAMGWMHRWTIEASREHAAACRDEDCGTCRNFVSALSLCAAVATTMPDTPGLRETLKRLHRDG